MLPEVYQVSSPALRKATHRETCILRKDSIDFVDKMFEEVSLQSINTESRLSGFNLISSLKNQITAEKPKWQILQGATHGSHAIWRQLGNVLCWRVRKPTLCETHISRDPQIHCVDKNAKNEVS